MRNQTVKSKLDFFSQKIMNCLEQSKIVTAENGFNPLQLTEADWQAIDDADLLSFASSKDRSYFLNEAGEEKEKIARVRQIVWNKLSEILKHYVAERVKADVDPESIFAVLAHVRNEFSEGMGDFGVIRMNGCATRERVLGTNYWLSPYDPERDHWAIQREAIFENAHYTCNLLESAGVFTFEENRLYQSFEGKVKKFIEEIGCNSINSPRQWLFVRDGFTEDGYYGYAIRSSAEERHLQEGDSGNTVEKFHLSSNGDKIAYLGDYYVEFSNPLSATVGKNTTRSPHYVIVLYPAIGANYNQALLFQSYRYLVTEGMKLDDDSFLEKLAEFAYLFSNMLPYKRGGSAICEWLMRGLSEAKGIVLGPFNHDKGIGWDWQAFLVPLSDYIKEFRTHFVCISSIESKKEPVVKSKPASPLECTLFGRSSKTDDSENDLVSKKLDINLGR